MIEKRFWRTELGSFFSNLGTSLYYSLTQWLPSARIPVEKKLNDEAKVIVSLTTKPSRMGNTWLVIESILRQKEKPDAVILYLSEEEFENGPGVHPKLTALQKRGLQIIFVKDNLKPHNKYFYAMEAFPKASVVTIDDDKIYPSNLVASLKASHKKYPDSISAVMTRCIKVNGKAFESYMDWDVYPENSKPSHALLSLGVCGVLFPGGSLHKDVFDKETLKRMAPVTDDMWLKIMALRQDTKVVSLAGQYPHSFMSLPGMHSEQLRNVNITLGKNDTVFEDLVSFYNIDIGMFSAGTLCKEGV